MSDFHKVISHIVITHLISHLIANHSQRIYDLANETVLKILFRTIPGWE